MHLAHLECMKLNLPILVFIFILVGFCGDIAQAQIVAAGNKASGGFKPMVVSGSTPLVLKPASESKSDPSVIFPKLNPYPNVGSHNTPEQAQSILKNTAAIPPKQMMPNKSEGASGAEKAISQLLNGMTGGGKGGGKNPVANGEGNDSVSYNGGSGTASEDGNTSARDRGSVGGTGSHCNPPVRKDYEKVFGQVSISKDSVAKVAGARCDNHPTDRLVCMACNLYFEVDPKDSYEGHVAVARSVMTRATSAPYPGDVCKVVYQHSERVAQYSWTFESPNWNPNHVLPKTLSDDRLARVLRASIEGLQKGPNGFTNYYAQNLVNPKWSREGSCAKSLCTIDHHTFCAINAGQNRSPAMYLSAEKIPVNRSFADAGESNSTSGAGTRAAK